MLAALAFLIGDARGEGALGIATDSRWTWAGCFIATRGGVVLTVHRRTQHLAIPMGTREPGESARATAARETWEETGIEVIVGMLAADFKDGRALLFSCTPAQPLEDYDRLSAVDRDEVAKVMVVDPLTMMSHDGEPVTAPWRFPDDKEVLRMLYEAWTESAP